MDHLRRRIEKIISEELEKADIQINWDMREIHVLPNSKVVIELTSSAGTLSDGLIEHHFPAIRKPVKLAHFTKLDYLKCILCTGELRLYSLLKRLNQQEFKSFSETHGLKGYMDEEDGDPYYVTLMNDLFYTSFTNINPTDETYMWRAFAAGGTGVKIILNVAATEKRSELRPVFYHSNGMKPITVIKSLSDRILKECGRHFIMRGISRIGAFYLPLGVGLEVEEEARLLIKSWGSGPAYDSIIGTGDNAYIPLKIGSGQNHFCEIEITEIQCGPKCDHREFNNIMKLTKDRDITVTYSA